MVNNNPINKANNKKRTPKPRKLLSPNEVASRFRVHPETVRLWETQGKLKSIKTPASCTSNCKKQHVHRVSRRYLHSEITKLLRSESTYKSGDFTVKGQTRSYDKRNS